MLVGFAIFGAGFFLVAVPAFMSGGLQRSNQLRVLKELLAGQHGPGRRWAVRSGVACLLLGAMVQFGSVAAGDRQRAQACVARCERDGYDRGRIGPNGERTKDRSTWWVACICEAEGRPPFEFPARSLE